MNRADFQTLAAQLRGMQDANKNNMADLLERAAGMGIDPAGLRRFVAWKRRDGDKRAQQDAIDQQCRYLAGERDTPAELPIGCELAQALNLYRRNMTVRQVAKELGISTGKAGKLRELARMFDVDVHVHTNVDRPDLTLPDHDPETGEIIDINPGAGAAGTAKPEGQAAPTGEIGETAGNGAPPGESDGTPGINDRAGGALANPSTDMGIPMSDQSCGGGESRTAAKLVSQGGKALAGEASSQSRPPVVTVSAGGHAPSVTDDTAAVARGPQDPVSDELPRGAMQPKGCAKVMRTEPSMSESVAASGDAVRDASATPLDVVAAPYEGREHVGSAASAPPACSVPDPYEHEPPAFLRRAKVPA